MHTDNTSSNEKHDGEHNQHDSTNTLTQDLEGQLCFLRLSEHHYIIENFMHFFVDIITKRKQYLPGSYPDICALCAIFCTSHMSRPVSLNYWFVFGSCLGF